MAVPAQNEYLRTCGIDVINTLSIEMQARARELRRNIDGIHGHRVLAPNKHKLLKPKNDI